MKHILLFAVLCTMPFLSAAPATFRPKVSVEKVENFDFTTGIDHPAWNKCKSYDLMAIVRECKDINSAPREKGSAKLLYDDKYFYVRADFCDSDIMTTATENGGHFYLQGDLVEVFLKPANANYYWEIYGTPNKLNTRFYFTSRSTVGTPSSFTHQDTGIKVASKIYGTLNYPGDKDKGMVILVAIPIAELNRPHTDKDHPAGTVPFAPGHEWRMLIARYNYSRYLDETDYSSFPQILMSYHALEYFAELELLK